MSAPRPLSATATRSRPGSATGGRKAPLAAIIANGPAAAAPASSGAAAVPNVDAPGAVVRKKRPVSALLHPTAARQQRHDPHAALPANAPPSAAATAAARNVGHASRPAAAAAESSASPSASTHVAVHDSSTERRRPRSAMARSSSASAMRQSVRSSASRFSRGAAGSPRPDASLNGSYLGASANRVDPAATAAVEELFSLCEQLQLPAQTLSALTFAAEDPSTRDPAVATLRSHKTATLAALRCVDARERILRCYEEVAADAAVATPRTKRRLDGELKTVMEALENSTKEAARAIDAWVDQRREIYGGADRCKFLRGDPELTFTFRGVDYERKMARDVARLTNEEATANDGPGTSPVAADADGGDEILFSERDHGAARRGSAGQGLGRRASLSATLDPDGSLSPRRSSLQSAQARSVTPQGPLSGRAESPRSRRSPHHDTPTRHARSTSPLDNTPQPPAALASRRPSRMAAAAAIQRAWRCHVAQDRLWYLRLRVSSAVLLQRWYRRLRRARAIAQHAAKLGRGQRRRPGRSRTTVVRTSAPSSLQETPLTLTGMSSSVVASAEGTPGPRELTRREVLENEAIAAEAWPRFAARRIVRFFRSIDAARAQRVAATLRAAKETAAAIVITRWAKGKAQGLLNTRRTSAAVRMQALARGHLTRVQRARAADEASAAAASSLMPDAGATTMVFRGDDDGAEVGDTDAMRRSETEHVVVLDATDGDVVLNVTPPPKPASSTDPDHTLSPTKGKVAVAPCDVDDTHKADSSRQPSSVAETPATASGAADTDAASTPAAPVEYVSPTRMPFPLRLRRVLRPDGPTTYPVFGNEQWLPPHIQRRRRRHEPRRAEDGGGASFGPFWAGDYESAVTIQSAWRRHVAQCELQRHRQTAAEAREEARVLARRTSVAVLLQRMVRAYASCHMAQRMPSPGQRAALVLQSWCRHLRAAGRIGPDAERARHSHEDDAMFFVAGATTVAAADAEDAALTASWQRRAAERAAVRVIGEWWWRRLRHRGFVARLREASARVLQRAWRDYIVRREYLYQRHQKKLAERKANDRSAKLLREAEALRRLAEDEVELQAWRAIHDTTLERIEHVNEEIRSRPDRHVAAGRIQRAWRSAVAREARRMRQLARHARWAHVAVDENTQDAATRIQARWRCHAQRHVLPQHRERVRVRQNAAAVRIQALARGWLVRLRRHRDTVTSSPAYKAAQRQRELLAELDAVATPQPDWASNQ